MNVNYYILCFFSTFTPLTIFVRYIISEPQSKIKLLASGINGLFCIYYNWNFLHLLYSSNSGYFGIVYFTVMCFFLPPLFSIYGIRIGMSVLQFQSGHAFSIIYKFIMILCYGCLPGCMLIALTTNSYFSKDHGLDNDSLHRLVIIYFFSALIAGMHLAIKGMVHFFRRLRER